MRLKNARALLGVVLALSMGLVASAQETPPATSKESPTVEQLQQRLQELAEQLHAVQQQLQELKAQQKTQQQQAEAERLRQEAAAEAARAASPEEVDTTTAFVSGTRMQPQLNPEISVTGNMFAIGGTSEKERASIGEWELDVQSYLDPYTRMHVVFSKPEDGGIDLEEGYVTWLNLPGSTSLTVGKKRQQFGVLNRWHPHAYDQVDSPWVLQESFGEEGLKGTGLSLDWLMPRLWAHANELTVEVMNGNNDVAFAGEDWQHPSVLARLKSYWDLTPDSYMEIGLNGLHGNADAAGRLNHDFYALDLTYNWYPANREIYHEFTLRGMLLRSRLDLDSIARRDAWGGYLYGQYKFSPHWIAGLRYDRVDDQREAGHRYWGLSPYLTFWESEFVRLRGQASYRRDNLYGADRRFVLQLTIAAGPHKHDHY
jgi:hypothetical protein